MNIGHLREFAYLAEALSFAATARHFFISASVLSKHVAAMEDDLQVKLFERDSRRVSLTEDGEAFYRDIAVRPANLTGVGEWHACLAPILGSSGSSLNVYECYKWVLEQIRGDMTRLVPTHDVTMKDCFESVEAEDGLYIHFVCK